MAPKSCGMMVLACMSLLLVGLSGVLAAQTVSGNGPEAPRPTQDGGEGEDVGGATRDNGRAVARFDVHAPAVTAGEPAAVVVRGAVDGNGTVLDGEYAADILVAETGYEARGVVLLFHGGEARYATRHAFTRPGTYTVTVEIDGVRGTARFRTAPDRTLSGAGELEVPWLRMISGLAIVIGLFCLGVWLLKRINQGAFFRRSRLIQVLDCVPVGKNVQIVVVRVADRVLVLATGAGGTRPVAEFQASEFMELTQPVAGEPVERGFAAVLKHVMGGKR